jgi:hypothetical protein
MKPLTPEEQLQMQLEVQSSKIIITDLQEQVLALSNALTNIQIGILSINTAVEAHHELLKEIVEKIK